MVAMLSVSYNLFGVFDDQQVINQSIFFLVVKITCNHDSFSQLGCSFKMLSITFLDAPVLNRL